MAFARLSFDDLASAVDALAVYSADPGAFPFGKTILIGSRSGSCSLNFELEG